MGQKVNPNIFRLGVTKTWKTEFFEKKRYELPLYTFKDLEIKSYVQRFFKLHGILLHDYKQHYSNSTINIYISYFISPEFTIKREKVQTIKLLSKSGISKTIKNLNGPLSSLKPLRSKPALFNSRTSNEPYETKKYLRGLGTDFVSVNKNEDFDPAFRNQILKSDMKNILNNFFKAINLFTKNKFNIIFCCFCLNKNLSFLKQLQKKNFILLQKFRSTPFLEEGVELLFCVVHSQTSSSLLAEFIAMQMKKVKRHKFFLAFLKQALTILLDSSFSKVKGIKVTIKGRLNGVPRAKHKTVCIGDIPVQKIDEVIDFSQTTVHNSNGSYGIKVWIVEKETNTIY